MTGFQCNHCGRCCENVSIIRPDYLRIKRVVPDLDKFLTQTSGELKIFGKCPFLTKNNRCRIYKIRPVVCRAFPVVPAFKTRDGFTGEKIVADGKEMFVVNDFCAQHHTISKREIKRAKILLKTAMRIHMEWLRESYSPEELIDLVNAAGEHLLGNKRRADVDKVV